MRGLAVFIALALAAPGLGAQTRDPTAAEALFKAGREATTAGDYASACPKFRESNRLDPAPGTVLNLADCEEHLGHVATAWTLFREVTQRVPTTDERYAIAKQRAAALEPRLPKLNVVLAGGAPKGARVLRDGIELGPAAQGTALPVDPGPHTVVVEAPGYSRSETRVEAKERQTARVVVNAGARAPSATGDASDKPSSKRTWGWALGGVGAAGLAVGTITGMMVLGEKRRVDDNCDASKRCNQTGIDAVDRGRTFGTVSGASFIVGGLCLAGGAYLLLSGDERSPATALTISPGYIGAVRKF